MPLQRKSDIADLDRGAGAFHKDASSHGRLGVTRESSLHLPADQQLHVPTQPNYIFKTSTSYFICTTFHGGWGYFRKRPEVGHVAFKLQPRLFYSKNSTVWNLHRRIDAVSSHLPQTRIYSFSTSVWYSGSTTKIAKLPSSDKATAPINVDQLVPTATTKIHGIVAQTGVVLVETVHLSSLQIVRMFFPLPTLPEPQWTTRQTIDAAS